MIAVKGIKKSHPPLPRLPILILILAYAVSEEAPTTPKINEASIKNFNILLFIKIPSLFMI